ncbi:hypothetical protein N9Z17_04250 [Planktomarina temperata]|nr:hypothetical protein [Planktomarina temperata]
MSNIRIVNLASHTTPAVVEDNRKEWVAYGEDNNYFQYLIDRYNGSATNNAIINGMTELMYGKGLSATDASRKPEAYAQMMSLFKRSCLRKVTFDLKALGQAAFQIIYNKDKSKIVQVAHMPIETLRFEKMNEDGEVCGYYYSKDWTKIRKRGYEPTRIPAFGHGEKGDALEIYCIKPYRSGFYYYSPVDYQGGIPYAELEEEVANYHINNIKNGLSPSMLINFNNGVPTEEERELIERRIIQKFSGTSNSGKFILAFNDNKEMAASIEPVQLSDASEQYQFLADESMRKLMVAHRVTSPMLMGIKDQSGLGNNADELKTASLLFHNTVIRPFQEMILDAIDDILAYNQISLNLFFKTLQPLELQADITEEQREELSKVEDCGCKSELKDADDPCTEGYEQIGMKMKDGKKVPNCVPIKAEEQLSEDSRPFLDDKLAHEMLDALADLGEEEPEGYELVDAEIVGDDEPEDFDVENYLNGLTELSAKQDSTQDGDIYKVRYKYVKGTKKTAKGSSRTFCKTMLSQGKLYRKEDIGMMSARGVNKSFGHKGRNYSLFKYKGGVNCYHRWERRIYKKKLKKNGEPYGGDALRGTRYVNVNQAVREGFKLPKNPKEVAVAPIDMPRQGHHPNYKG